MKVIMDVIMIKWIFDVMGDPGAPGQFTLNVIMIIDIMDDPGAPGQFTLNIIMVIDFMDYPGAPGQVALNICFFYFESSKHGTMYGFFFIIKKCIYICFCF